MRMMSLLLSLLVLCSCAGKNGGTTCQPHQLSSQGGQQTATCRTRR